jgi:hypothetical protein
MLVTLELTITKPVGASGTDAGVIENSADTGPSPYTFAGVILNL